MEIDIGIAWRSPEPPRHVFIVLSRPNAAGEVLVANLTTLRETCIDDTTIFEGGEHPVIKHQTTVAYSRAKVFSAERMKAALRQGILTPEPPFEGNILKQILAGAIASPELAQKFKAMID